RQGVPLRDLRARAHHQGLLRPGLHHEAGRRDPQVGRHPHRGHRDRRDRLRRLRTRTREPARLQPDQDRLRAQEVSTDMTKPVQPLVIDHIGFLVENLEEAIERWSIATGYTFSPIARYRTQSWIDDSNPEPHWHDARISFSKEGSPAIELMEFHGEGTHSAKEGEGFHHIAFMNVTDIEERKEQMAQLGFSNNG